MDTIEIQGKSYRVKAFDDFTLSDCRRIAQNWERAADRPDDEDEFFKMIRAMILILSPRAAQDDKRWSDTALMKAVPLVMVRLGELMIEWGDLWKRCGNAADIVHQRFLPRDDGPGGMQ
jgi:hypothetical protein